MDEAGRGALAGPVVAAAVVFSSDIDPSQFADSKQLTPSERDRLFEILIASNAQIGIGVLSHRMIDKINIFQATMQAMTRAVHRLKVTPYRVLIDGNRIPKNLGIEADSIVKGDTKIPAISAASIIAKVTRDRIMIALDKKFPGYGFAVHKGYATSAHYDAIFRLGPCDVHRKTFNLSIQERLF